MTCTITNSKIPVIKVIKALVPDSDSGLFDLQIDSTDIVTDAGHTGTTGWVQASVGDHSVGELAGTGTSLGVFF